MRKLFLATLLAAPAAALAHHGWSEYDSSKLLKLTGKIAEAGYEHPHGHVRMETPGKTWNVILAPPIACTSTSAPSTNSTRPNRVIKFSARNCGVPQPYASRKCSAGSSNRVLKWSK